MRIVIVILAFLALTACGKPAATNNEPMVEASNPASVGMSFDKSSMAAALEYLLASAASDFQTHGPLAVDVRNVRLGYSLVENGEEQYMLCGEFLPAGEEESAKWWPFATLKTSAYEQWLGAQAVGICEQSSIVWEESGDLTSELRQRIESGK